MCEIGYGGNPEIMWLTSPKARKTHICCECESEIIKGERYELIKGVWEGVFATFKTCSFCASLREKAHYTYSLNYDEGFAFGDFWECVGMDYR